MIVFFYGRKKMKEKTVCLTTNCFLYRMKIAVNMQKFLFRKNLLKTNFCFLQNRKKFSIKD